MIDDVIVFLEGRTNPIERDLERRMREASERQQFEEAARTRNRLMAVRHLSERQPVVGRQRAPTTWSRSRSRTTSPTCSCSPCAAGASRSAARTTSRTSAGEGEDELLARFLLDYYDAQVGIPPLVCVPAEVDDDDLIDGLPLPSGAARRVEVRVRRARRQAPRASRWPSATPSSACATTCCARSARARAASRRSRSCARRSTSRRCRSASSASTSRTCRTRTPSPRWSCSRTAAPKRSDYRRFGIRHDGGQDDFRSIAEAVHAALRALPARRRGRLRPQLRDAPEPGRDRRRQGPARRGARRHAGASTCRASRSSRSPSARRRSSCPGAPQPVLLPRDSPGLQLLQRIRDEAHRFALRGHRTRRAAGQTDVAARHSAGRRAERRARAARALRRRRPACSRPRARSSRPCPVCRRRSGATSTTTCTASGRRPAAE